MKFIKLNGCEYDVKFSKVAKAASLGTKPAVCIAHTGIIKLPLLISASTRRHPQIGMRKREIQASVGQRLLWLKHQYEGQTIALNCPVLCEMIGPLDRGVLRAAVNCLIHRHESLRTTFVRRGRELRQVINEAEDVAEHFQDVSELRETDTSLDQLVKKELNTWIDPTESPLRVTLWRLTKNNHLIALNLHHLVTDTWSCMILQRELGLAYDQIQSGRTRLPPVGWQPSQFMAWQERQFNGPAFRRHREYWRAHLTGARAPRLPLAPLQSRAFRRRASICATIDPATTARLRNLAIKYRTTIFTITFSVYHVLLNSFTGQSDLAVATLFSNRTRRELENTVGFLVNLAVLRTQISGVKTVAAVIEAVRNTVLQGMAHQELPFHMVSQGGFAEASPKPDEMIFQMLSERIDETYSAGGLEFRGQIPDVAARFDLELALMPLNDCIKVKLDYAEDRLSSAWASQFLSRYVAVAAAFSQDPNRTLTALLNDVHTSEGPISSAAEATSSL